MSVGGKVLSKDTSGRDYLPAMFSQFAHLGNSPYILSSLLVPAVDRRVIEVLSKSDNAVGTLTAWTH